MSARRYLMVLLILAGAVVPALTGVSCPPPGNPAYLKPTTTTQMDSVLPPCDSGFVCISIVNTSCVPVEVALYTQDGYDLNQFYDCGTSVDCCPEQNAQRACKCWCPGALTGELQLTPPQLFVPPYLTPIAGANTTLLTPGMSKLVSIQCQQIKNMGIRIGKPGTGITTNPEFQAGVYYRCPLVLSTDPTQTPRFPSQVPCGQTIEMRILDRNDCVTPNFTLLSVVSPPRVSLDCSGNVPIPTGTGTTTGG